MSESVHHVARTAWSGPSVRPDVADVVAVEEPLEMRCRGVSIAVVMRTPGADEALIRGFFLTEQMVARSSDIVAIRECTRPVSEASEGNVYLVHLRDNAAFDVARHRRNFFSSSSCGLCGKATIESVMRVAEPIESSLRVPVDVLLGLLPRMRGRQALFDQTGGLHAAAAFDGEGRLLEVFEDVGRHNAVDKVVGALAGAGGQAEVLAVSGRVSFEVVQKALAARIPVIVAVSAPTSLSVQLAQRAGVTLCAFARDDKMSVYTHEVRIIAPQPVLLPRSTT